MGPLAVRSESLTGLPSVPLSVKSGAFWPTSSALTAAANRRLARTPASSPVTMLRCDPISIVSFRGSGSSEGMIRPKSNPELRIVDGGLFFPGACRNFRRRTEELLCKLIDLLELGFDHRNRHARCFERGCHVFRRVRTGRRLQAPMVRDHRLEIEVVGA